MSTDPSSWKAANGHVIRLKADGSVVDSIPIRDPGLRYRVLNVMTGDGGNPNFTNLFHAAVSPLGAVVFGESKRYRFIIRSATGSVRVVERSWTPIDLNSAERDNWQEFADFFRRKYGDKFGFIYTIPKTKPAYRDLIADQDGRIWVSLYTATTKRDIPPRADHFPTLRWRQNAVYDVFDPFGAYPGRVELPRDSRLLWARGDRIWVLATGADDEQRVVSYAITGMKRQ